MNALFVETRLEAERPINLAVSKPYRTSPRCYIVPAPSREWRSTLDVEGS